MASLNMAKVNTLIREVSFLAGVMMAANIFVGNEMMASSNPTGSMYGQPETEITNQLGNSQNNNLNTFPKVEIKDGPDEQAAVQSKEIFHSLLFGLLSHENIFNLIGGLVFSVANNYLKWWDYNPGGYWNLRIGCLGLRSKRFLNGILQFEGNFNLGRGAFWLIMTCLGSFKYFRGEISQQKLTSTAAVIMSSWGLDINKGLVTYCLFFFLLSFQGFVSIPLTLHFSKFSISISLDSFIWGITGMILEKKLVSVAPIGAEKKDDQNGEKDQNDYIENNNEIELKGEIDNKKKEEGAGN